MCRGPDDSGLYKKSNTPEMRDIMNIALDDPLLDIDEEIDGLEAKVSFKIRKTTACSDDHLVEVLTDIKRRLNREGIVNRVKVMRYLNRGVTTGSLNIRPIHTNIQNYTNDNNNYSPIVNAAVYINPKF